VASFNKVILIGRLTRDPESRSFSTGNKVAKFGFAVGRSKKNPQTGQWENDPNPLFIDCEAFTRENFTRLHDVVMNYCKKGSQIMVEGQRIAALVERFLRFAQPASNGKQPLPINEPLLEAISLLKGRLQESGVHVVLEVPSEPLLVLGQAGQLEQAFLDLLHNAIEAMIAADQLRIIVHADQQGGWVRVAISDTGRGIMPDHLRRVFEPGFTTKVDNGISRGLGLGLYATHAIIQDHWGRIEVQSQLWQGSTFTVFLPAI